MKKPVKIPLISIGSLTALLLIAAILFFYSHNSQKERSSSDIAVRPVEKIDPGVPAAGAKPFEFHGGESASSRAAMEKVLPVVRKFIESKNDDGLLVAVVTSDGVSTQNLGSLQNLPSYQDAYIEIGSITKAFVGMALASLINDGTVTADTKLKDCLPQGKSIPAVDKITLGMLASHSSGLPRVPQKIFEAASAGTTDPYAGFTDEDVWDFLLTDADKIKSPGSFEYSNLGTAVLAQALTVCAGETSWETLLANRVIRPLGLEGIQMNAPTPLIQGHDAELKPVPEWHWQGMGPAGALKANIMQMAKLAQEMIRAGEEDFTGSEMILTSYSPLYQALQADSLNTFSAMAMNWHLGIGILHKLYKTDETKANMAQLIWHNGQTAGTGSCIAVIPSRKTGVVILSNTSTEYPQLMALLGLGSILGEQPEYIEKLANHLATAKQTTEKQTAEAAEKQGREQEKNQKQ